MPYSSALFVVGIVNLALLLYLFVCPSVCHQHRFSDA